MKYPSFFVFLFLVSCQNSNSEKISTDTKSLFERFREAGRTTYFSNSNMGFGEEIDKDILYDILKMDTSALAKEGLKVIRKNAFSFEEDSTLLYFNYGIVKGEKLKSLNARSIKNNVLIDEIQLIDFTNSNTNNYRYYFTSENIGVTAINSDKAFHYTFFSIKNGKFEQISFFPRDEFHKPHVLEYYIKSRILIYNDFETKELVLPSGKRGKVYGKIIESYGAKEMGFWDIIQLEPNAVTKQPYLSFNASGDNYDYPKDIFILSDTIMQQYEGPISRIIEPIKKPKLLVKNAFFEFDYKIK